MQTSKQCKFHAKTNCVYTELEPCLRQTKISWYPALNIRTDIKHTTEDSSYNSQHTIKHSLPPSCYKRAGTHAKPWLPTL